MASIQNLPPIYLTITGAFPSAIHSNDLLTSIRVNLSGCNRLILDEGNNIDQEIPNTRPKDLKTSIENINKHFDNKPVNQQIYFAPRLLSKLVAICVYL